MDTGTIWTILATVVATLVTTYFGHWLGFSKDKKLRQDEVDRHARYLAVRVVCTLDPFVIACSDLVQDSGISDQQGEVFPDVEVPTLSFPDDVDWKSIKPESMYRVLSLPNKISIADEHIRFIVNMVDGPLDHSEYFEVRTIEYGELGLIALDIANDMRKTYQIPENDYSGWDPRGIIEGAIAKVKKSKEEARARQAEMMRGLAEKAQKP